MAHGGLGEGRRKRENREAGGRKREVVVTISVEYKIITSPSWGGRTMLSAMKRSLKTEG